jgi:hypothetical protein
VVHAGTKKPAFAGFFNNLETLVDVSGTQIGAGEDLNKLHNYVKNKYFN